MDTYSIVRFFIDPDKKAKVKQKGLTLEQAQEHCKRPDTKGQGWFDGYRKE